MAKSRNTSANNRSYKAHRGGIKRVMPTNYEIFSKMSFEARKQWTVLCKERNAAKAQRKAYANVV